MDHPQTPPNPKGSLNPYARPYFKATPDQSMPPRMVQQAIPMVSPFSYKAYPVGVSCYNVINQPLAVLDGFGKKVRTGDATRSLAHRLRSDGRESGGRGETLFETKPNTKNRGDGGCGGGAHVLPDGRDDVGGKTSVMIRNIPNQLRRRDLVRILDTHCLLENKEASARGDPVKSAYDFIYLPMDFRRRANLGYAFVNFTSPVAASRFQKAFHNYDWKVAGTKKICAIACAAIQGKNALYKHFKNSVFYCHTNGYLPVVLSPPRDGQNSSKFIVIGRRWNQ